ncbi:hypothetical protein SUGI_0024900 [Cryptomeria japonica]|nr:hypothetical protein SUGI_0024900 [Cryptomeria japonica]
MEKINGGYSYEGQYFLLTELQGRAMIRLPPRRGDIKRQIFASMADSLVEFLRALRKRGQKLNKLNYNQIVLFLCKMCLCSNSYLRNTSWVEALNQLKHVGIQN